MTVLLLSAALTVSVAWNIVQRNRLRRRGDLLDHFHTAFQQARIASAQDN